MRTQRHSFHDLVRHPPAGWHPRGVSYGELAFVASLASAILLAGCYLLQLFFFDSWAARTGATAGSTYLRFQLVIGAVPFVACLILRLFRGWFMPPPMENRDRWSHGARLLFHLREAHRLKVIWVLVFLGAAWAISPWGAMWSSPVSWQRQMPPSAAVCLTALLAVFLKRERFHPRVHQLKVPAWLVSMVETQGVALRTVSAAAPVADILLPDDQMSFEFPFLTPADLEDHKLDPAYAGLGVYIGGDTRFLMRRLQKGSGGRLYQRGSFRGVHDLLNPNEGPMEGVGLLEIKRVAAQVMSRARTCRWSDKVLTSRILSFVQDGITYQSDEESTGYIEYGRFPLQTLEEVVGDCDCSAILVCSLLSICGFDSGLALLLPEDGSEGHAVPALRRPEYQGRFAPVLFGRLNGLARSWLSSQYLYGESTAPDGGKWRSVEQLDSATIAYFIPIKANPFFLDLPD